MKITKGRLSYFLTAALGCAVLWATPACRSEALGTMDEVHAAIHAIVADPGRAASVIRLTEDLAAIADDTHTEEGQFEVEVRRLYLDYDTTRAQLSDALAAHDVKLEVLLGRLSDNRKQLVDATTPKEWEEIAKIRARAFAISAEAEHPSE